MALNYTYLKYKDTYSIKNNEAITLTYSISTVTCEATTEIKTGTILPGQTVFLNFPVDGTYSVYLSSPTQTEAPFIIKHYYNLLTSFISMVEGIVCGCSKCNECEECNKCEDYLGTFMKAQAFNIVNYPVYQGYINQVTQDSICLFNEQILCSLLHEKVYGNVETKEVMLRLISFYYLGFYYEDKYLAADQEEIDYITVKYKFDKIGACMRKLGIMPTDPLYMTTTTTHAPVTTLSPTTTTTAGPSTSTTTIGPTTTLPINTTSTTTPGSTTTTTNPITTTTTTTTVAPCALDGNAVQVVGTTTTTVAPTSTTTSTTTTTLPNTTTINPENTTTTTTTTAPITTTTTTQAPVCNLYIVDAQIACGGDPGHSTLEYTNCSGVLITASIPLAGTQQICALSSNTIAYPTFICGSGTVTLTGLCMF